MSTIIIKSNDHLNDDHKSEVAMGVAEALSVATEKEKDNLLLLLLENHARDE